MSTKGRSLRFSAVRQLVVVASLALTIPAVVSAQQLRLVADSGRFLLDGKPFQIISGEMHYARVPRESWRDRLHKARMMGLNTISTYVFWNLHEPAPGKYDFSGQNDVAEFIRLAGAEGLHVILRPGPYVCAEWELGGYPAWLLADTALVLRSTDPRYTQPAERWMTRLGQELAPLMSSHGGPIIGVQVENEYGSFDRDKAYMAWQHDLLVRTGFGGALLYTADGDVQLPNGTLPDLPAVVNFGVGGADSAFARLARFRPQGPLMSGEYWAGWFDQWGVAHHTTNVARQVRELTSMLTHGYSVNLYMFHGGTTPGFMNGANIDNRKYLPQTSSYDYDAALDESGRPTPKFLAFRDAIATVTHTTPIPMEPVDSAIAIPAFSLSRSASLWGELGKPVHVDHPRNMESFGQSYGYILYRTSVRSAQHAALVIKDIRDYARIYVNGTLVGTLDRRLGTDSITVDTPAGARLDVLVENLGRVNFNKPLRQERKGILNPVTLGGTELTSWDVYTLPMSSLPKPKLADQRVDGPGFYAGTFNVAKSADTFLDTRGWGKGTVWLNGHHLGRFWDIGPEQTLYVPGPWLHAGRNDILVFSYDHPALTTMSGLSTPILRQMNAK